MIPPRFLNVARQFGIQIRKKLGKRRLIDELKLYRSLERRRLGASLVCRNHGRHALTQHGGYPLLQVSSLLACDPQFILAKFVITRIVLHIFLRCEHSSIGKNWET